MKKLVTSLLVGLFLLWWSNIFSIDSPEATPLSSASLVPVTFELAGGNVNTGEQICLDLSVNDFQQIEGFQFSLSYDKDLLKFDSVPMSSINLTRLEQGSFGAPSQGKLTCSWFNTAPVNLNDGTTIAQVCFSGLSPGTAAFSFSDDPLAQEAYNSMGEQVGVNGLTSDVTVTGLPTDLCGTQTGLSFFASNEFALPGEQVCVEVTAQDFTDIVSFQWTMNFDENLMTYDSAYGINLGGFDTTNIGNTPTPGELTVSWLQPGSSFNGVTIPDCEPLFAVCFIATGPDGSTSPVAFNDDPAQVEVTDKDGNVVADNLDGFFNGSVSITNNPPGASIRMVGSDKSVQEGDQVCVDVSANGFTDLNHLQFSMNWNDSELEYVQVRNFNLPGLDGGDFTAGADNLTLEWDTTGGNGITVSSGTSLYQVCFNAIGAPGTVTNMTFTSDPLEALATNTDGDTLSFSSNPSVISIEAPPGACGSLSGLSFYGSHETVAPGDRACVEVTAQDFIDIVSFQWSMHYDQNLLRYDSAYSVNLPGFDTTNVGVPPDPGQLTISWLQPGSAFDGVTVADCEVLFVLCFETLGQDGDQSDVAFSDDPTSVEITDAGGNVLLDDLSGFLNGSVRIQEDPGKPPFRVVASNESVEEGESVCVDVTVEGFNDVVHMQYSMDWDPALLDYQSISGLNLTGLVTDSFDVDAANGKIGLNWDAPGGNGITLTNGTRIFQLCFNATGAGGTSADVTFTDDPTSRLVTDGVGDTLTFRSRKGVVTIEEPPGACGSLSGLSFYASHETVAPGEKACVEVTAQDFIDILSFQWSMNYDPAIMEYDSAYGVSLPGFDTTNIGIPANNPGTITISWLQPGSAFDGESIPDCEVLFVLCFETFGQDGDQSDLNFSGTPTSVEVANADGVVLLNNTDQFLNGSVKIQEDPGKPPFRAIASNETVMEGDPVCVDVSAEGFTDVVHMQYSMSWDPALLDFQSVGGFNLSGLEPDSFRIDTAAGRLGLVWDAPGGNGVTLANGTDLYQVCFLATGAAGSTADVTFGGTPTSRLVTDGAGDTLTFNSRKGVVTIEGEPDNCGSLTGLSFYASNETAMPGDRVCVEVTAQDFVDIISFQWSMEYDPAVLTYDSAYSTTIPGFDTTNVAIPMGDPGTLTISWLQPGSAFDGETIPDCEVLFVLCFDAIGGDGDVSPVAFSDMPTSIEVANANGNVLLNDLSGFVDGSVRIEDMPAKPPFRVLASNETVEIGDPVCVDVTVEGFTDLVHVQYSMNWDPAKLQFTNVQNFNLAGLDASDFTPSMGSLGLTWDSQGGTGRTRLNGTKIYEACFTAVSPTATTADVTFSGSPTSRLVTDTAGDTLTFTSRKGVVTIEEPPGDCGSIPGLSFYASNVTSEPGERVCVEVTTQNFIDIISFQWSMQYDPDLLEYDSAYSPILPGFDTTNVAIPMGDPGTLTVSWLQPGSAFDGETLPDCEVLFVLCFDVIGNDGETSPVDFSDDPTSIEVADAGGSIVLDDTTGFLNGSVEIKSGGAAISVISSIKPVECVGSSTGAIDLSVSGGNGSFTYSWDNGADTQDLNNIPAGDYTVTITSGPTLFVETYSVDEPADSLRVTVLEVSDLECFGDGMGGISLGVTGGWGNYFVQWNGSFTFPNQTFLDSIPPGDYFASILDGGGCRVTTRTITVNGPSAPLRIASSTVRDIDCAGRTNGSISITPTGGTPFPDGSYTYNWSPSANPDSRTQTALGPDDYFVTITDQNGCAYLDTFTIASVDPILITLDDLQDANMAPNGSISITVSGGVPSGMGDPYEYNWIGPNNATFDTKDISGLYPGTYMLTIVDNVNCSVDTTFQIGGNVRPPIQVTNVGVTNTCPGEQTGSISVDTTGGERPITISWNGPGGPHPADFDLFNLGAGDYSFTITDNRGDEVIRTITVNSYNPITVVGDVQPEVPIGNGNGSIQLTVSGGSGNFSYTWTPGNIQTRDISNLEEGIYSVLITDNQTGCTQTASFDVPGIPPASVVLVSASPVSCIGDTDGSFTIELFGMSPFIVRVNNNAPVQVNQNTFGLSNLGAGDYRVIITDDLGSSDTLMINVPAPPPFSEGAVVFPKTSQQGGRINLSITGGTPPYDFRWSNGSTTEDLFDLEEGCYKATITDDNGCTYITNEYCVALFQLQRVDITNVKCADDDDGQIVISVGGGNEPYRYEWMLVGSPGIIGQDSILSGVGAGTYMVRIVGSMGTVLTAGPYVINAQSRIDANAFPNTNFGGYNVSCFGSSNGAARVTAIDGVTPYVYSWETGDSGPSVDDLEAGVYSVTATDAIGCTAVTSVEITQPDPILANEDVREVTCFGGSDGEIRLFPSGGVPRPGSPAYSFEWGRPGLQGQTIRFLNEGVYMVTISDANDCEEIFDIELLGPADPLSVTMQTTRDDGTGSGSAFAIATGGTPPYNFEWRGLGLEGRPDLDANPLPNLFPGTYTVEVTDANGCTILASATVIDERIECLATRTVITPDGDGLNENFYIHCLEDYPDNHLEIYNRWGQLVFETDDYMNDWSGTTNRGEDLPEGGYFFIFEYRVQSNQTQQLRGSFSLLRE